MPLAISCFPVSLVNIDISCFRKEKRLAKSINENKNSTNVGANFEDISKYYHG
jgi:hypothetical protein